MISDLSGSILYQPILDILKKNPQGLSEFDLIRELKEKGYPEFNDGIKKGEKKLFESHFVLFHILYSLKNTLAQQKQGFLNVSCLDIRFFAHASKEMEALGYSDKVADYYLDWSNFYKTTKHDVHNLLNSFWKKYLVISSNKKQQALSILGLTEPTTKEEIKKCYKKLAFNHHPDRGGDTAQFQRINAAMQTLQNEYIINN